MRFDFVPHGMHKGKHCYVIGLCARAFRPPRAILQLLTAGLLGWAMGFTTFRAVAWLAEMEYTIRIERKIRRVDWNRVRMEFVRGFGISQSDHVSLSVSNFPGLLMIAAELSWVQRNLDEISLGVGRDFIVTVTLTETAAQDCRRKRFLYGEELRPGVFLKNLGNGSVMRFMLSPSG